MISAVTHATQTEPTGAVAAQSQPVAKSVTSSQKSTPSQPQSKTSIPTDTVQISNAAKAALQETIETPAETAKEARETLNKPVSLRRCVFSMPVDALEFVFFPSWPASAARS